MFVLTIFDCNLYSSQSGAVHPFFAMDSVPDLSRFISTHCQVLEKIELKVGAQVMLTKNLDVQKGLVNGARGVVTGFDTGRESEWIYCLESNYFVKCELLIGSSGN